MAGQESRARLAGHVHGQGECEPDCWDADGNLTPDGVTVPYPGALTPATFGMPDPAHVGTSEYRAIYDCIFDYLSDASEEDAGNAVIAMLREFLDTAASELRRMGEPPRVYSVIEYCGEHGGHAYPFATLDGARAFIAERRQEWLDDLVADGEDASVFETDTPDELVYGEHAIHIDQAIHEGGHEEPAYIEVGP